MNTGQQAAKAPLNFNSIINIVLSYERYGRLMGLLFVLGLLAGVSVYIYKRGQYTSRSVIRFYGFVDPAAAAAGVRQGGVNFRTVRAHLGQLGSRPFQLQTARHMGVVGDDTSWESLRANVLPGVSITMVDDAHFQLDVFSYFPNVAEQYPEALLDTFYAWRQEQRQAYREEAVARYMKELEEVRKKMNDQLERRLQFEEDSAIAKVRVELDNLSRLPVEMIRIKHVLAEMERTRDLLDRWGDRLDAVGKLSLLTAVPKYENGDSSVGKVLRPQDRQRGQLATAEPLAPIVLQPGMMEGLAKWEELDRERRRLQENLAQEEERFLADHPVVVGLRQKISEVERGLALELQVALKAFELEVGRLSEELANIESSLPKYYEATRTYDETSQEYDLLEGGRLAWDQAFKSLTMEVEKLDFNVDRESIDFENLGFTRLENRIPVSPSKKGIATQGLALGLALAFGIPFLLLRLSSTITSVEQVERSVGIKGLTIVALSPLEKIEASFRKEDRGHSAGDSLLESFRIARTQILLDSEVDSKQAIVVSSAKPGEGKTTMAANLAWSFASMGERTLLVDCDLRRGRLHNIFSLPNAQGLNHFLLGQARAEQLVNFTGVENLFVVPRGLAAGGTADSLNAPAFQNVVTSWRSQYDRIVFDSPPMLGLSDTALIQKHADGIVFVASYDQTLLHDIASCAELMRKLNAHIFGFVLNRVDFSELRNSHNYYYYSSYYHDAAWGEEADAGSGSGSRENQRPRRKRRQPAV